MTHRQLPFRAVFKPPSSLNWPAKDVIHFRTNHFQPEIPVTFRGRENNIFPAIQKWFTPLNPYSNSTAQKFNEGHFNTPLEVIVPVELTSLHGRSDVFRGENEIAFERGNISLEHFKSWIMQKLENPSIFQPNKSLYLAQCDLSLLPQSLRDDIPPPNIVALTGKGDIYASSLWIGIPPTHTPLHRDPNPNILVQLAGKKTVRLLQPLSGKAIYEYARRLCAEVEDNSVISSTSIRGDEMMVGLERKILGHFIWVNGNGGDNGAAGIEDKKIEISGYETTLEAGDGVFIPNGWWHSVKGIGDHKDGINASVSSLLFNMIANTINTPLLGELVVSIKSPVAKTKCYRLELVGFTIHAAERSINDYRAFPSKLSTSSTSSLLAAHQLKELSRQKPTPS
jgi:hypothetical protein